MFATFILNICMCLYANCTTLWSSFVLENLTFAELGKKSPFGMEVSVQLYVGV
jgi:hypothetical protein